MTLTRKTPIPRGKGFKAKRSELPRSRMKQGKGAATDRRDKETRADQFGEPMTGRDYLHAVRLMGCAICHGSPSEAHHCFHGRYSSGKASHFDAIPLCEIHHRTGGHGVAIHAGKETWAANFGEDHKHIGHTRWMILGETT